jgi:hypothetical protein
MIEDYGPKIVRKLLDCIQILRNRLAILPVSYPKNNRKILQEAHAG